MAETAKVLGSNLTSTVSFSMGNSPFQKNWSANYCLLRFCRLKFFAFSVLIDFAVCNLTNLGFVVS